MKKLSDHMDFDHVIQIASFGVPFGVSNLRVISDRPDLYAPSLLDGELDSSEWEFFSTGYSRQDSYSGPIMHNSESIGGRLESDMIAECGIFAAIIAYWTPEELDELMAEDPNSEMISEGWAIVRYVGPEKPLEASVPAGDHRYGTEAGISPSKPPNRR